MHLLNSAVISGVSEQARLDVWKSVDSKEALIFPYFSYPSVKWGCKLILPSLSYWFNFTALYCAFAQWRYHLSWVLKNHIRWSSEVHDIFVVPLPCVLWFPGTVLCPLSHPTFLLFGVSLYQEQRWLRTCILQGKYFLDIQHGIAHIFSFSIRD